MKKRGVKKKVDSFRFSNIAAHHKQLLIIIISIVAIISLSLFMFTKEPVVGKAEETGIVPGEDCVKYCQFKTVNDGNNAFVNVPFGETVFTSIANKGINIHVKNISEGTCFLDVYYSRKNWGSKLNISLIPGQYALEFEESANNLRLEKVGCDSCVQPHSTSLGSYPAFGEYYEERSNILFGKYVTTNLSFKPDFAVNNSGNFYQSCQDNVTVQKYVCSTGQLVKENNTCSNNFECFNGFCVEKWTSSEGRFSLNFDNGVPDNYFWKDLNPVCLDENTLIKVVFEENKFKFVQETCVSGCHFGHKNGWNANCFTGCTDTDNDELTIQGNVTGLVLEDYPDGISYETLKTLSDGCSLDQTKIVELSCEGNYIKDTVVPCSSGNVCVSGACQERLPSVEAIEHSDKRQIKIKGLEDVTVPFFVSMTLYGENNSVLARSEIKYPHLNEGGTIYSYSDYPNENLVKKKEVIVYDVPDPNKWTVFLNETFVMEYNSS
jgi:hypothetical protein